MRCRQSRSINHLLRSRRTHGRAAGLRDRTSMVRMVCDRTNVVRKKSPVLTQTVVAQ